MFEWGLIRGGLDLINFGMMPLTLGLLFPVNLAFIFCYLVGYFYPFYEQLAHLGWMNWLGWFR